MTESDELVRRHKGLVALIVFRDCRGCLKRPQLYSDEDAMQDGFLGLLRAAEMYDDSKGKFSNWAPIWIRAAVSRDFTAVMGSSYRRAVDHGEFYPFPASLDAPVREDGGSLFDLVADVPLASEPPDPHRQAMLDDLLDRLNDRDRIVVTNQKREAGALLGIKPASAARRRARIYDRLRAEVSP